MKIFFVFLTIGSYASAALVPLTRLAESLSQLPQTPSLPPVSSERASLLEGIRKGLKLKKASESQPVVVQIPDITTFDIADPAIKEKVQLIQKTMHNIVACLDKIATCKIAHTKGGLWLYLLEERSQFFAKNITKDARKEIEKCHKEISQFLQDFPNVAQQKINTTEILEKFDQKTAPALKQIASYHGDNSEEYKTLQQQLATTRSQLQDKLVALQKDITPSTLDLAQTKLQQLAATFHTIDNGTEKLIPPLVQQFIFTLQGWEKELKAIPQLADYKVFSFYAHLDPLQKQLTDLATKIIHNPHIDTTAEVQKCIKDFEEIKAEVEEVLAQLDLNAADFAAAVKKWCDDRTKKHKLPPPTTNELAVAKHSNPLNHSLCKACISPGSHDDSDDEDDWSDEE